MRQGWYNTFTGEFLPLKRNEIHTKALERIYGPGDHSLRKTFEDGWVRVSTNGVQVAEKMSDFGSAQDFLLETLSPGDSIFIDRAFWEGSSQSIWVSYDDIADAKSWSGLKRRGRMGNAGGIFESLTDSTRNRIYAKATTEGIMAYRGETEGRRRRGKSYSSDPGDLGRGVYYTVTKARAKTYGKVRRTRLIFTNPVVLSMSDAYDLAGTYGTVQPPEDIQEQIIEMKMQDPNIDVPSMIEALRMKAATEMTMDLLELGHDGLIAVQIGRAREIEIVDYRPYIKEMTDA